MKIIFAMLMGASIVFVAAAKAQVFDPESPDSAEIIRESFINSDMLPDGIAFVEQARILRIIAERDFEQAVESLATESGLSIAKAEEALTLSLGALDSIAVELRNEQRQTGCESNGQQKLYGENVYVHFEQMDDVNEVISASHLAAVKRDLGEEAGLLFGDWLDSRKRNTSYIKFDFKKAYERSGESADGVLAGICASLKE